MSTTLEAAPATAAPESPTPAFKEGDFIGIPCEALDVPFPEKLVVIETLDGKMEGFVSPDELRQTNGQWQIRGVVHRSEKDRLVAWVWGEFNLTSGIINLPLGFAVPA